MPGSDGDSGLANADIRLFESGNLADATIICGGRTWKVHKVILGARCKWFKAAFYGNMAEASSARVVLQEQNPDLIDIFLRFVYARDREYEIKQLKKGPDMPSLCVQVFRVADFFLVDELKELAIEELNNYFEFDVPVYDTSELPDPDNHGDEAPTWLTEILDAFEEAYKDQSTSPILKTLVELVYERRHLIFCFTDAAALLDKIPELAKDLMKDHIIGDLTKRQAKFRFGLTILKATQGSKNTYLAGTEIHYDQDEYKEPTYLLYPLTAPSTVPFVLVHPQTEREQSHLQWITPRPSAIKRMSSHTSSPLVLVTMSHGKASLGISFGACGDARLYVELYVSANPFIEDHRVVSAGILAEMMPKQFLELSQ